VVWLDKTPSGCNEALILSSDAVLKSFIGRKEGDSMVTKRHEIVARRAVNGQRVQLSRSSSSTSRRYFQ
jgi:hypothetical protein